MKRLFLAFTIVALTACGLDKAPDTSSADIAAEPPVAPTEVATSDRSANKAEVDPLATFAERLVSDYDGFFRFDRIRDAKNGGQERQVFVEMVGPTEEEAANRSARILEDLGYSSINRFGDKDGIRLSYKLEGEEPIRVLVRAREVHSKLNNENSTSSVYLTAPVTAE